MSKKYKRERAWIYKKINSGVSQDELRQSVGIFSNKKKKKVMEQKSISSKQYDKRKSFLGNGYALLNHEKFEKKEKIIPRTSNSAFRSRDYTRAELNSLIDDIDSIRF